MATTYNVNDLVRVAALKALAERVNQDFATKTALGSVSDRVQTLESVGAQANVIEKVSVNGIELTIQDGKLVDIIIPTKVSDITNDSKFQTDTEVEATVAAAIAAAGHASFETAESVPTVATAKDNVMYLVKNTSTGYYDIYAKVGTEVVRLDDTTVDLTDYATTESVNTTLQDYVQKDGDKVLSDNNYDDVAKTKVDGLETTLQDYVLKDGSKVLTDENYTSAEKTKLDGITSGATKVESSTTNGSIKINGIDTVVYTESTDVIHGSVATDEEIGAMLDEVFNPTA